jgi:non-specific serine/threonine protein kinase
LRSALYSLRQTLEGPKGRFGKYLTSQAGTVRFNTQSAYWLDVEEFARSLKLAPPAPGEERATRLGQAVSLYQGNLLAGFYDDWVLMEQEHLKESCLQALKELIAYHRDRRAYGQAMACVRRGLSISSFHEDFHHALIELYALTGDREAALRHYLDYEATLKRELKAEPLPEIRALYEQARRGEILKTPGAPPARHNLLCPASHFVGRKKEMAEVKRLLSTHRLITLTGVGGCGKTRLALHVGAEVAPEYAEGVWFVDLGRATSSEQAPPFVARALGLPETAKSSFLAALEDYLQPRQLLLILDNCEHLVQSCAQLSARLLARCPGLKVLATSRERLHLLSEVEWKVPPLSSPPLQSLLGEKTNLMTTVSQYEAPRLFCDRAFRSDDALTDREALTIAKICHQLDGVPLAIELAAARASILSLEEIAERLDDCLGLLAQENRIAPRHQSIRATLDWSYDLLSVSEQTLFRRLAVFAGGFTLEMVEGICSEEPLNRASALDLLTQLLRKSLVAVDPHKERARFRLLEILRQYGREKLQHSGEEKTVCRRHRDWFLRWIERVERELWGTQQESWLKRLEQEHDNLRAALEWSRSETQEREISLRIAGAIAAFWDKRGHWSEGRKWLEEALILEQRRSVSAAVRAKALHALAQLAARQDDDAFARARYDESLALFRTLKNKRGTAQSLAGLGYLALAQGDPDRARSCYEESLRLCRESEDHHGIADALHALGHLAHSEQKYELARSCFEESLKIRREFQSKGGIGLSLFVLGSLAYAQGDYALALKQYEESLGLFRELGDKRNIAWSLNQLGSTYSVLDNYEKTRSCYDESLALFRELGDKRGIASLLSNLGRLARLQGNYATARALHEESLQLFEQIQSRLNVALAQYGLGILACEQGDYDQATRWLEKSSVVFRDLHYTEGLAVALLGLGRVAQGRQEYEGAMTLYKESLVLCERGSKPHALECLERVAEIACIQGAYERSVQLLGAVEVLREILKIAQPLLQRAGSKACLDQAREQLTAPAFAAALAYGRRLSLEQAIECALAT